MRRRADAAAFIPGIEASNVAVFIWLLCGKRRERREVIGTGLTLLSGYYLFIRKDTARIFN